MFNFVYKSISRKKSSDIFSFLKDFYFYHLDFVKQFLNALNDSIAFVYRMKISLFLLVLIIPNSFAQGSSVVRDSQRLPVYELGFSLKNADKISLQKSSIKEISGIFRDKGVVFLKDTDFESDLSDYKVLVKLVADILPKNVSSVDYSSSGINQRNTIGVTLADNGKVYLVHPIGGKKNKSILIEPEHKDSNVSQHSDLVYSPFNLDTPDYAVFACKKMVSKDKTGYTNITDMVALTNELIGTKLGKKMLAEGLEYSMVFYDDNDESSPLKKYGQTQSWQSVTGKKSKEEAEQYLRNRVDDLTELNWLPNGSVNIVYKRSGFVRRDNKLVTYLSFGHASYHFRSKIWPDDISSLSFNEYPYNIRYGDKTQFSEQDIKQYVELQMKHSVALNWEDGDIAVIDAWKWAHGRTPHNAQVRLISAMFLKDDDVSKEKGSDTVLKVKGGIIER